MSRIPRRPRQLVNRIFSAQEAVERGVVTLGELRSAAWRPVFRGVYADAQMAVSHMARCEAATRWLLPAVAAVAGRSAAAYYGGPMLHENDPVEVITPPACRFGPVRGLHVHTTEIDSAELATHGGLRVTSPLRTCWDLAQWCDLDEAVALIDSLLGKGVVKQAELERYALGRTGRRGGKRFVRAVGLADPGAESPPESRTRVALVLAGMPRPVTQHVVEDHGRFVARVDLAWPEYRVAVEYDGVWHAEARQFHRDRQRLNRLVGQDWIVLHLTAQRLRDDLDGFTAEVRAALRTRGWRAR
ncbi:endonuclease domain-containing protein [Catellatospora sichuanensis]|uniref:endonuclease domain-containing protein n=1 Tax=Catellatospora sichuanensis TaxID=1969805 RepID=UPI001182AD47|nr:DUF559 domain-containing protein [Catellatospora sichuanensis]